MAEYPLALAQTQAFTGVTGVNGNNISVPQGTTTEEFKEYLKENEPDTFEALENVADKHPPKVLSPEEYEKLMHPRLGNAKMLTAMPKPSTVKSLWTKFENWLLKYTSKSHNMTVDKLEDKIETGRHIWDLATDNSQS